jgi:hypothetical protein
MEAISDKGQNKMGVPMNIDILYFQGCPNSGPTVRLVQEILTAEGVQAAVREVDVPDAETARRLDFPGSPTVRVNGQDIEPGGPVPFGYGCRTYVYQGKRTGIPPRNWIESAIRGAAVCK